MNHSVASGFFLKKKKEKRNRICCSPCSPQSPTLLRLSEARDKKPTPASPFSYCEKLISAMGKDTEYILDAFGFGASISSVPQTKHSEESYPVDSQKTLWRVLVFPFANAFQWMWIIPKAPLQAASWLINILAKDKPSSVFTVPHLVQNIA